jgi:hypothetical protein
VEQRGGLAAEREVAHQVGLRDGRLGVLSRAIARSSEVAAEDDADLERLAAGEPHLVLGGELDERVELRLAVEGDAAPRVRGSGGP